MIRSEPAKPHLDQELTDLNLPSAWKSGSLKYGELKMLAEGGTAKLFLTNDKNLNRTVAYKTLHADLRNSEVETKRFLREARERQTFSTRAPYQSTSWVAIGRVSYFLP